MTTNFKLAEYAQLIIFCQAARRKSGYMKMSLFNDELDLCMTRTPKAP
jgi:hypothetical protein